VTHIIKCRAKVTDLCFDGEPTKRQFGEDLPMSDDGLWDGETIICDPCYMKLIPMTASGMGLKHELDEAIQIARMLP
jgi:hypothetical protein